MCVFKVVLGLVSVCVCVFKVVLGVVCVCLKWC